MPTIYRNNVAYSQTVAYGGFTPVGTVISVMGNDAPANYLKCDGTVYNITDYPDLANYFKAQFGTANKFGGDGTDTFAVPDLRGEFLRGTGTNSHTNQGSGSNVGTHQDATTAPFVQGSAANFGARYSASDKEIVKEYTNVDSAYQSGKLKYTSNFTNEVNQDTTRYTSRPTNTSVLYCIAYKNIYIENGGGGSGSSGHTILDTDGNVMQAEDNLQFIGLLVQDDSGNNVTTIEAEGLNQDSLDDIANANISGAVVGNGLNYTTSEQIVGRWVDGKPIYQRTFIYSGAVTSGTTYFATDFVNTGMTTVIKSDIRYEFTYGGTAYQREPYYVSASDYVQCLTDKTGVYFIGRTDFTYTKLTATVKYIKT